MNIFYKEDISKNVDMRLHASRNAITEFLFVQDAPEFVDFAFVLGCPSLTNVDPALDLYFKGLAPKLFMSGSGPIKQTISEAEKYKIYAMENGVPEHHIFTETDSTNTLENFIFSYKIIEQIFGWKNIKTVAICGKPFHMRRALMTAHLHWPQEVRLLMIPSTHPDDPPAETWWQTEGGRIFIMNELRAIGTYGLNGDIGGF